MTGPAARKRFGRETLPLLGFLLLAFGLAAALMGYPGTPDVITFLNWGNFLHAHGPFAGYAAIADYPPLGPFFVWAALGAGVRLGVPELDALKLAIAAAQAAAALLARWRYGNWAAAGALWLIICPYGSLLGYIDCFYLPCVLLALFALERDRFAAAGFLMTAAALIKWQPLILGPALVIYAISRSTRIRRLAWMLPGAALAVAIGTLFGWRACWGAFSGAVGDPFFSGQGFNLDWIVTGWIEVWHIDGQRLGADGGIVALTQLPAVYFEVSKSIYWIGFAGVLGVFAWHRKNPETLCLALLACEAVQFNFNTGVHENHAFLMMIMAFAGVYAGWLDRAFLGVIAALAISNILLFYGLDVIHGAMASAGTISLACLNLLVCFAVIGQLIAACRRAGRFDFAAGYGRGA